MAKGNRIAESIAAAANTAASYCLIALRDGDTENYRDFARDAAAAAIMADAEYAKMDAGQIAADAAYNTAAMIGDNAAMDTARRESNAYSRAAIKCLDAAKTARNYAEKCAAAADAHDAGLNPADADTAELRAIESAIADADTAAADARAAAMDADSPADMRAAGIESRAAADALGNLPIAYAAPDSPIMAKLHYVQSAAMDAADACANNAAIIEAEFAEFARLCDAATDAYSACWNAAESAAAAGLDDEANAAYRLCNAAIYPNDADDRAAAAAILPAQISGLHAMAANCDAAMDAAAAARDARDSARYDACRAVGIGHGIAAHAVGNCPICGAPCDAAELAAAESVIANGGAHPFAEYPAAMDGGAMLAAMRAEPDTYGMAAAPWQESENARLRAADARDAAMRAAMAATDANDAAAYGAHIIGGLNECLVSLLADADSPIRDWMDAAKLAREQCLRAAGLAAAYHTANAENAADSARDTARKLQSTWEFLYGIQDGRRADARRAAADDALLAHAAANAAADMADDAARAISARAPHVSESSESIAYAAYGAAASARDAADAIPAPPYDDADTEAIAYARRCIADARRAESAADAARIAARHELDKLTWAESRAADTAAENEYLDPRWPGDGCAADMADMAESLEDAAELADAIAYDAAGIMAAGLDAMANAMDTAGLNSLWDSAVSAAGQSFVGDGPEFITIIRRYAAMADAIQAHLANMADLMGMDAIPYDDAKLAAAIALNEACARECQFYAGIMAMDGLVKKEDTAEFLSMIAHGYECVCAADMARDLRDSCNADADAARAADSADLMRAYMARYGDAAADAMRDDAARAASLARAESIPAAMIADCRAVGITGADGWYTYSPSSIAMHAPSDWAFDGDFIHGCAAAAPSIVFA